MGEENDRPGPEWGRVRQWWRKNKERRFSVEIQHHIENADWGRGPHRWALYAWIYPGHWLFPVFDDSAERNFRHRAVAFLELHMGASYVRAHRNSEGVTAWQVGCDYNHLHDEFHTECDSVNHIIEEDAERLWEKLSAPIAPPWLKKEESHDEETEQEGS